jgi:hypothetical protein
MPHLNKALASFTLVRLVSILCTIYSIMSSQYLPTSPNPVYIIFFLFSNPTQVVSPSSFAWPVFSVRNAFYSTYECLHIFQVQVQMSPLLCKFCLIICPSTAIVNAVPISTLYVHFACSLQNLDSVINNYNTMNDFALYMVVQYFFKSDCLIDFCNCGAKHSVSHIASAQ